MFDRIREDIRSVFERDPAARSWFEVVTCYPGLWAVWFHRVAHKLWKARLRLLARLISQHSRFVTGIEVHPAAAIGRRLFIDHGMGVVIGETAIIGDDVTLYQGVTICDNVFIGNNTNVLGNICIGENSRIGAGSVVLTDVPPNSTAVGVPAHIVYRNGERILVTDPHEIKDPLSDALIALADRMDELETQFGSVARKALPFAVEEAERSAYRKHLDRLAEYVSMGEGI
jgi:serine O-acetyltransferase